MKKPFILFLTAMMFFVGACSHQESHNFVLVKGGNFLNSKSNYYGKNIILPDFYIGKYEVTQKEWMEVMGSNPSQFKGDNMPVESVSWYECIEYCNQRSIREGLPPYYHISKDQNDPNNSNMLDDIKWTVTFNAGAHGYRLLTEAEWEYAAGGGQMSKGYKFSGNNHIDDVAWYWRNSGDHILNGEWLWPALEQNHCKTKAIGCKEPNELGLYDMSGNVREWCWDWHESTGPEDPQGRVWKGGGWMGGDFCCELSYRGNYQANGKGSDQGFRICMDK
jgi:formylglycine-generating enzyme